MPSDSNVFGVSEAISEKEHVSTYWLTVYIYYILFI